MMCCEQLPRVPRLCVVIQVVVVSACVAAAGCGNSDGRLTVTGTVTFDGEPLTEGYVSFRPKQGTASPSAGATIYSGRFQVDGDKGVLPGAFDVQITATRKTGKKKMDPGTQTMLDEVEQYLPARYNTESNLQADIQSGEKNDLTFELHSD